MLFRVRYLRSTLATTVCAVLAFGWAVAAVAAADTPLDRAAAAARRIVAPAGTTVLAGDASQEGHWTFVDAKGERFTASNASEMGRMPSVLAPDAKGDARRLTLVVTARSLFAPGPAMRLLPSEAQWRLATDGGVYRLGRTPPYRVALSDRLAIEAAEPAAFAELIGQLDRSLARRGIRVVALDPAAPATLGRRIAAEAAAKGDLVERIDPLRLAAALPALRGQTVVITGRIDGKLIQFQVPGAADRSLILDDLSQAAAAADVNLVILETPSGRQPGSRNWLWLKAEVQGADGLYPDSGLDGLLSALASPTRPLAVRMASTGERRTVLVAVPVAADDSGTLGGIGDALSRAAADLAGSVTGRIEPVAIRMFLVSLDRARELDRRLVSWLPAWATWGYLGLLALGALGAPASWRWWAKLWPAEAASDYPNALGLTAARAVRLAAYALLFMPAVAVAAVVASVVGGRGRGSEKA